MDTTGAMMQSSGISTAQVEQLCSDFRRDYELITREIGRVIVGQREVLVTARLKSFLCLLPYSST